MCSPKSVYQIQEVIAQRLPCLRSAQQLGLALWVYGTILAQSACLSAVLAALEGIGSYHRRRQILREWLADGKDKSAPCCTQVQVKVCSVYLVRWLLSWYNGKQLLLALDPTGQRDQVVVLSASLLYRGSAIPLAWKVLAANQKGEWGPHWQSLLALLQTVIPTDMQVLVFTDRGLWSPSLYRQICQIGWHPLMRVRNNMLFTPKGQPKGRALALISGVDQAWVGQGIAFGHKEKQVSATLIVLWLCGQPEPCLVLTNLRPRQVGIVWYGLRTWIEAGFRLLKSSGWQFDKTRRTDPARVERHWLVLAVATLWTLACGTRAEDAHQQGQPPSRVFRPTLRPPYTRASSLLRQGIGLLRRQLLRGYLWKRLWLSPQPLPCPPDSCCITYHDTYDTG